MPTTKGLRVPVTAGDLPGREDPKNAVGWLTRKSMLGAIGKMLHATEGNTMMAAEILKDNADADAADVWFQFAVMGEQVYG